MREPRGIQVYEDIKKIAPLRSAFDLLQDHVIITDENANILYANKAVERSTGFSISEIIFKNPGDLWGGKMPKEFYEKMWHAIKIEKKPFVGEVQNLKKDGTAYWQELHISPILDEQGEVKFFIGIEPEIGDRKQREQFREEFVSIVGHQLRDPITAIVWTLEWLFERGGLPKEEQENLKKIYVQSRGLSDLIADLLVLARIGKGDVKEEDMDLAAEIQHIIEGLKEKHPVVSFEFEKKGDTFLLHAVKPLALQVFLNIISNAAEYSDRKSGKVSVTLVHGDGQYIFSCENNGEPIPEKDQPKILSKFFRASNASKIKERGTGLGLFIVKTIADTFGWKVGFKSPAQDAIGAMFYVEIPVK